MVRNCSADNDFYQKNRNLGFILHLIPTLILTVDSFPSRIDPTADCSADILIDCVLILKRISTLTQSPTGVE